MSTLLTKISAGIPSYITRYVDKSDDIAQQIESILEKKRMTQRELANALNKKESEVSKWLTGRHNFTIKSIAKIEEVLGEEIVITCQKAKEKYPKIYYKITHEIHFNTEEAIFVTDEGDALTSGTDFTPYRSKRIAC